MVCILLDYRYSVLACCSYSSKFVLPRRDEVNKDMQKSTQLVLSTRMTE